MSRKQKQKFALYPAGGNAVSDDDSDHGSDRDDHSSSYRIGNENRNRGYSGGDNRDYYHDRDGGGGNRGRDNHGGNRDSHRDHRDDHRGGHQGGHRSNDDRRNYEDDRGRSRGFSGGRRSSRSMSPGRRGHPGHDSRRDDSRSRNNRDQAENHGQPVRRKLEMDPYARSADPPEAPRQTDRHSTTLEGVPADKATTMNSKTHKNGVDYIHAWNSGKDINGQLFAAQAVFEAMNARGRGAVTITISGYEVKPSELSAAARGKPMEARQERHGPFPEPPSPPPRDIRSQPVAAKAVVDAINARGHGGATGTATRDNRKPSMPSAAGRRKRLRGMQGDDGRFSQSPSLPPRDLHNQLVAAKAVADVVNTRGRAGATVTIGGDDVRPSMLSAAPRRKRLEARQGRRSRSSKHPPQPPRDAQPSPELGSTCAACGYAGHSVRDCIQTTYAGHSLVCPFCETYKTHLPEHCPRLRLFSDDDIFELFVRRRGGKSQIKTKTKGLMWPSLVNDRAETHPGEAALALYPHSRRFATKWFLEVEGRCASHNYALEPLNLVADPDTNDRGDILRVGWLIDDFSAVGEGNRPKDPGTDLDFLSSD